LGKALVVSDHARDRFRTHFGPLNQVVKVGSNYSLVIVDAPGLSDEDDARAGPLELSSSRGEATQFIQKVTSSSSSQSVILFTHIPLHRPEGSGCGPFRERGTIRAGTGRGYQNMLSPALSRLILDKIRPVLVLSGDDHDYCEYTHDGQVREITVKSFSMAMGIRKPGFQLLSIPKDGAKGSHDRLCLLPDQLRIYLTVYLSCVVVTILMLLISPSRQSVTDQLPISSVPSSEKQAYGRRVLVYVAHGFCPRAKRRRRRGGCIEEFMKDFWDVVWAPLSVFLAITTYMFF